MAVKYKVKKFTHGDTPYNGQFYARATVTGEMDIFDVADVIQQNCSMKRSDVMGVLTELIDVMKDALQNSKKVRLNGLGTFKPALTATLVDTPEEVTAQTVKRCRIIFTPEYKKDAARRHKVALLQGTKVEPLGEYRAGMTDKELQESKQ